MNTGQRVSEILRLLDEHYPFDVCFLSYDEEKPWQLLFSTILSAQCTDDRVNMISERLYEKYKTLMDFAHADPAELEEDIKPAGFFHIKAAHIKDAANMLLNDYGGRIPEGMDELLKLPGVGRKTANLLRGHIFRIPSMIVDTHVKRVSRKLSLTENEDPEKIEYDLMAILPPDHWTAFNIQIIAHGRAVCKARKPDCAGCFLNGLCGSAGL